MNNNPPGHSTGASSPAPNPYKAPLEHAIRWWNAEEENARRFAQRVNLDLTIVGAFLGLGAYHFITEPRVPGTAGRTIMILVGLGSGFLFWGALTLLSVTPAVLGFLPWIARKVHLATFAAWMEPWSGASPASHQLRLTDEELKELEELPDPPPNSETAGTNDAFWHTYKAAARLAARNVEEEGRIDVGQRRLVYGFTLILVAAGVYLFWNEPKRDTTPTVQIQQEIHGDYIRR